MRQEMDAEVETLARLNATGIAYVAFATSNPGLFKLMFGSSAHQASGDPELDAARTSAYEVLSGAVHRFMCRSLASRRTNHWKVFDPGRWFTALRR